MRGAEVISAFLEHSPYVGHLGMKLDDDRATLALPFSEEIATIGDVVHGSAVSTLVDASGLVTYKLG
ncbi:MAG TPA: hypothetical protein VGF04_08665 [Solirubrobacterales bacterium]